MSEFAFIYVFLLAISLCIAAILIIRTIENRNAFEEDEDIITKFIRNRTQLLAINMPKLTIRTYLIITLLSPVVFGMIFWIR